MIFSLKKENPDFATPWMNLLCDGHRRAILSLLIDAESRMVVAGGVGDGVHLVKCRFHFTWCGDL